MTKTKVLCSYKKNDNILIVIEIEDKFESYEDDKRIFEAFRTIRATGLMTLSAERFRERFNFAFE